MELARILVYGDIHLSSKNYGAHIDYPKETLDIFHTITEKAKEFQATHIIGCGDLTYGRFNNLEYREKVEHELSEQNRICGGRRYEVKGNHDSASYGMTEYEYYIRKGLLKPSENLQIGPVNINMVDYGKMDKTDVIIDPTGSKLNVIVMHDFIKFSDTLMRDYGSARILDNFIKWYGVDYIIGGHIHNSEVFEGLILKKDEATNETHGHRAMVDYLGCMTRPSFHADNTDEIGHLALLTVTDEGLNYNRLDIPLLPLSEVFNIQAKQAEKQKKIEKEQRVDISDIVKQLNEHERNVGNPEDIIMALSGVDEAYKLKAIELLKIGLA